MLCLHGFLKIKQKCHYYQISPHLPLSRADKHIHCIYLMHLELSLLMVLSIKTKIIHWLDTISVSDMKLLLSELTFAGPLGFG